MRLPVTVLGVALASALGCAPTALTRIQLRGVGRLPAASADLAGDDGGAVLDRAAVILAERGLQVASREAGRIVTAPRELDVPCGRASCLARELVVVRVGERSAHVELLRGVWDPAARCWIMALAPAAAEDAAAQEVEILAAILAPATARAPATAISLAPR